MVEIVGIRFKTVGKIYYFDPAGVSFKKGDRVVVETSQGTETGEIIIPNTDVAEEKITPPLKKVLRHMNEKDKQRREENAKKEKHAFDVCVEKIKKHQLDMKLIDVEYTFDGNKILFYFTADGRIDFRELVKDLASVFRTRIELRQIGVRDEAKMLGGLGVCGRGLCCATFLGEFEPVSIKMAKEQGLSLNPTKISGTCGRLMCCLKYEQAAYEDLLRVTPRNNAVVKTPKGKGVVQSSNLLRGLVTVKLEQDDAVEVFPVGDVQAIKQPKPAENAEESSEIEK